MATPYLGEVRMFAGTFAPKGYHFCDGTLLSIQQNGALYSLIGTYYGGDGMNTFGLPDLRGRVPVSNGQGPGLGTYAIGQSYGTENVTLMVANMSAHNHPLNATGANATSLAPTPSGTMTVATSPTGNYHYAQQAAPGLVVVALAATDVTSAGGNLSHTNVMPILAINYIIALQGIFPSFS